MYNHNYSMFAEERHERKILQETRKALGEKPLEVDVFFVHF